MPNFSKEEIKKRLSEFNTEAQELFELPFVEKMKKSGYKVSMSAGQPIKIDSWGPDINDIKAFCNDIRKFIQKNDTLKAEKLQEIYQSTIILAEEKTLYGKQMSEIERVKKADSNHMKDGKKLTNQDIFEVFLYGKISHRTDGVKEVHDDWSKNPIWYASTKNEFLNILIAYLIFINNLVVLNKQVLQRLS